MRFNFLLVLLLVLVFGNFCFAQKILRFVPTYGQEPLEIPFQSTIDKVTISKCQWYISQLRAFDVNTSEWVELAPCQLMNAEDSISMEIWIDEKIKPSRFSFLLGTDSLTNVAGIFEGPLDPIHGMYWAWNSGYIHFKLEGTNERIASSDKRFEYHIGGYLPQHKTAQNISLDFLFHSEKRLFEVGIDIGKLFQSWEVHNEPNIMLPGPNAVRFSAYLPNMFFVAVP